MSHSIPSLSSLLADTWLSLFGSPESNLNHNHTKTSFWDVAAPEYEIDQRFPIFDPQLRHLINLVRDQSERVIMAKRSAEMAAHLTTIASSKTIAKAHKFARRAAVIDRQWAPPGDPFSVMEEGSDRGPKFDPRDYPRFAKQLGAGRDMDLDDAKAEANRTSQDQNNADHLAVPCSQMEVLEAEATLRCEYNKMCTLYEGSKNKAWVDRCLGLSDSDHRASYMESAEEKREQEMVKEQLAAKGPQKYAFVSFVENLENRLGLTEAEKQNVGGGGGGGANGNTNPNSTVTSVNPSQNPNPMTQQPTTGTGTVGIGSPQATAATAAAATANTPPATTGEQQALPAGNPTVVEL